jgi:hypothetical protein
MGGPLDPVVPRARRAPHHTTRIIRGPIRDADAPFVSEIPAAHAAGARAGRGGSSSLRSAWRAIVAACDRVQDSVIGDVIALGSLAAIFIIFILAGVAFG